jgi:hypothetical protein
MTITCSSPARRGHAHALAFAYALASLWLAGCATDPRTFYVAPAGNDTHTGTLAAPFATLPRAMRAVRELRQSLAAAGVPAGPVSVLLRGGTYEVREPITFTSADSGSADAPVTYCAYRDEQPVLSGGKRLTGAWTRTPGKPYWQLDLPEARDGKWAFCSLFVNGQSRTRARTPNWGQKVLRAEGREPGGDPRQALQYFPGDVDPAWSNPTDIDVVLLCSWTPTIHRIKEIVPERRAVRFFSAHTRTVDAWERNFRYYLSNVFEALDEPGEWYLNRHAGTLYYYPLPGEDVTAADVVAPVMRSRMITFEGDLAAGAPIEHLRFRGLAFRHLDGDMDTYNGAYRQGHMYLTAAVAAKGLRHACFERCEFAQLGEYALELADGCRDVAVRQCHFWDLGAGALQLGVTDLGTLLGSQRPEISGRTPANSGAPASDLQSNPRTVTDLVVDNCLIHRLGTIWHGCYGIVNRFASRTRITHNDIYDTHWDAIGLDARWNWKGETYSCGTVVAYNHLHDLGLRYHTDAAGVYQFGPLDTHIHHNLIHDTRAYPYICGYAGIYLDEQSRGALVENNLVYNADWYAYFQHKGMDNLFRNNIGAFSRDGLLWRGGLNEQWKSNYMEACRNVYVSSNAVALKQDWQPGLKPPFVHDNLYHTLAPDTALTFAGKSFAEWQALGRDTNSVVADPGFRNPAAFDFSLAADAPACRLIGFVPFDAEIRKAGLTGDAAWRALPKRYPPRTPSAVWAEDDFARLNAFGIDANLLKDGDTPGVFRLTEQKGAGFAVTREVPGVRGPACVKCTDRKGLPKSFYPYMHVAPRNLKNGRVTFTFAARLPAEGAAPFCVEMRGKDTGETGPSIAVATDGSVQANGKPVCKLQPNQWASFTISLALGPKNTGAYTLTTRAGPAETTLTLPFGNAAFSQLAWLGVTAPADADGCFYLDGLKLTIDD